MITSFLITMFNFVSIETLINYHLKTFEKINKIDLNTTKWSAQFWNNLCKTRLNVVTKPLRANFIALDSVFDVGGTRGLQWTNKPINKQKQMTEQTNYCEL